MEIEWKPIPNFSSYEASSEGRIRNKKTGKLLGNKPLKSTGYISNQLKNDNGKKFGTYAHRFICMAFHGPAPDGKTQVDHINRIKDDNKPSNLRWACQTMQNNNKHKPKERQGYPIWQLDIKTSARIKRFINPTQAAKEVGGHRTNIGKSARERWTSNGYRWEFETLEDQEGEIWKRIERKEKHFWISTHGRLKDDKDRPEPTITCTDGYLKYNSKRKGFLIHRLVMETFVENPNNLPVVNHKDSNKQNNRLDNLEWVTASENLKHAWESGSYKDSDISKTVYEIKVDTGEILNIYKSTTEAGEKIGVHQTVVSSRVLNKTVKDGIAWSYEPTFTPKPVKPRTPRKNPGARKIYKYDTEGNLIAEYKSISACSRSEGIPATSFKLYYMDKEKEGLEWLTEPKNKTH